ncbi:MAG: hypothetical protein GDA38_24635 [Hormoscilla sp. SP12CHS1]|nr:hypothetical protein [Hormoscilla sp. SP12CHS1]
MASISVSLAIAERYLLTYPGQEAENKRDQGDPGHEAIATQLLKNTGHPTQDIINGYRTKRSTIRTLGRIISDQQAVSIALHGGNSLNQTQGRPGGVAGDHNLSGP